MDVLIKGNSKMGKDVYIFNLPPIRTCTPTTWCLGRENCEPNCYALKGNFVLESVKISQQKD